MCFSPSELIPFLVLFLSFVFFPLVFVCGCFLCSLFSQLILPLFLEKDNVTFSIRHHWDSGKRAESIVIPSVLRIIQASLLHNADRVSPDSLLSDTSTGLLGWYGRSEVVRGCHLVDLMGNASFCELALKMVGECTFTCLEHLPVTEAKPQFMHPLSSSRNICTMTLFSGEI